MIFHSYHFFLWRTHGTLTLKCYTHFYSLERIHLSLRIHLVTGQIWQPSIEAEKFREKFFTVNPTVNMSSQLFIAYWGLTLQLSLPALLRPRLHDTITWYIHECQVRLSDTCVLFAVNVKRSWWLLQTYLLWYRESSLYGNNTKLSLC